MQTGFPNIKFSKTNHLNIQDMKNFQILLLFTILVSAPFLGCKNSKDPVDNNDPVVTIASPTENEAFLGEIQITINVTDESLHEMSVKVTKDSDGSVVYEDSPEVHDLTSIDFSEHFTPPGVSGVTNMTLTVVVEDHGSNIVTKTVHFTVQ